MEANHTTVSEQFLPLIQAQYDIFLNQIYKYREKNFVTKTSNLCVGIVFHSRKSV